MAFRDSLEFARHPICENYVFVNISEHTVVHFRPVITRWSGSTSRMRVIGEARNANLRSRTRLIAVSVVYWWVGNLYDVCIGLTELGGLWQSPCKM